VLDAVYDGPLDARNYEYEPVILEGLPTLEGGDAALEPVHVGQGERVLSAHGQVMELLPDVTLYNADDQEVVYEGGVITMTQMVVTFTLRSDVTWADGEPLTAEDSRFSYELAGRLDDAALRRRLDHTASYEVKDSRTIVWTGVPGYRDTHYLLNLYHPLPRHVLGNADVNQLLENGESRHVPLGWGPFAVETWDEGDYITLVPNPYYFRASEGLPHLDRVTFRFVADREQAAEELLAGQCDVVSEELVGSSVPAPLQQALEDGSARLISAPSSEWEHLDFGIQPASWSQRMSFFGDRQVRQAIAHCVDQERIAEEAFPGANAAVANSLVLPQHPLHAGGELHDWPYDPAAGRVTLEEAGWRDANGDGMLEAQGMPGIAAGTVFSVTLLTTQGDAARQRSAGVLEENLAQCGVGLTTKYLPPDVFYADGPDGPVFGRQFDLALFSWLNGLGAPCGLYLSTEIPREENWWATSNNPGYASEAYDQACRMASNALYGTQSRVSAYQQTQRIFSRDLPVLPLYFVPRMVVVGSWVDGVVLDPSQTTAFWNIESFSVGP
jgi:peptide/nickel transport system substrate-binding protein